MDARALFLQHLDVINRIAEFLCKRSRVLGDDAEDFAAEVRFRLVENDYEKIRQYRGASSLTTYLTVVITRQFFDYRDKLWGKWRPSAEAKRLGATALFLETAIYRDGCSFEEACAVLTQGGEGKVDRAELRRLFARLPRRTPHRRFESESSADDVPASDDSADPTADAERQERLASATAALRRAISRLGTEDQAIIKLLYFEGFSVADVARGLHLDQRTLYPRRDRLLAQLCRSLADEGIAPDILEFLDGSTGSD